MTDYSDPFRKIDIERFKDGMKLIEMGTWDLSVDDMKDLNERGYIPTGIMNYLIAIRASIGNNPTTE